MKKYVEILVDGHWLGHRDFEALQKGAEALYIETYPEDIIKSRSWFTGSEENIFPGSKKWSLGLALQHFPEHVRIVEE